MERVSVETALPESQEFIFNPSGSEDKPRHSFRCSHPRIKFMGAIILFVLNIACIVFSSVTVKKIGISSHRPDLSEHTVAIQQPVASLCVECDDVEPLDERMRRYPGDHGDDMCCPRDHRQTAAVLNKIYTDVRDEKEEEFLRQPQPQYSSFVLAAEPEGVSETLWHANRAKPSGHVTGIRKMNADEFYSLDQDDKAADLQVVGDWPLRVEPYRTVTTGYVQRLTWGLKVPAKGLYRVHTSVNFYFRYENADSSQTSSGGTVPVIHQLSRYHMDDGHETLLAERNHTIASSYRDGVCSFLVTLAELEAGDVVLVKVSHEVAMGMQDRWHSEGLVLVE